MQDASSCDGNESDNQSSLCSSVIGALPGAGSFERLLDLARTLAGELARAERLGVGAHDLRLAQALSLNVVDLLEAARRS